METRIAVIGIIVENKDSVESVNELLHQYSQYIIGRMGLPYPKKKVNICLLYTSRLCRETWNQEAED